MPTRAASPGLLERDAELEQLGALATAAARRDGALVLLAGEAGIGKTALIRAAREAARERGLTVLSATGSELDRDFAFGLVHQLLDPVLAGAPPERRARLLTGAAALAEPVLLGGEATARGADPGHAVLHGLYWAVANLADEEPLALVVDDLHWGDRASLRFLEFLGRRLEGLPVLVVGATRPSEPGAEAELLAALAAGPAAYVLSPAPLSAPAVAEVLAGALGAPPAPPFADAAAGATGGNPLLLTELARAAAERGLRGSAGEARDVEGIGAAGVAGHVRRRLAALGPDAAAVAAAAALLGDRARLDDVAALAGLDEAATAAAGDLLVQAGVLTGDERGGPRAFVHPLVREAVASAIPPGRRSALHAAAARRLAARGVRPDEVAVHLLATDPAGDAWVVEALVTAARAAAAEGAPEAGVTHLRRALAEPPAPEAQPALLYELGTLEAAAGDDGALEHLTAAVAAGPPPQLRLQARTARARLLLHHDVPVAFEELLAVAAEARDPEHRVRLEAMLLDATMYDLAVRDRRAGLLRRDGEPSAARLAHLAIDAGYAPAPRAEVEALARRALAAPHAAAVLGAESPALHLLGQAVRNVELADLADEITERIEIGARREGSRMALFLAEHCRAFWNWWFGSLASAEAHARTGLDTAEQARLGSGRLAMSAILAEILRERGKLDEAERLVEGIELTEALALSVTGADFLSARGAIRWLRGRRDDAEADLRRARELLSAWGWGNPLKGRASLRLAELLAERGEPDEARELADDLVAITAAAGTPGAHGMALRVAARAAGGTGDEAQHLLHQAADALAGSRMQLEHARARHDLGALLRREGRRSEAREELRLALDLADRCGAGELAGRVREELRQAGARPRRAAMSGPESLTPSERRVAELAARGLTNREIAETLWVSRKTVEVHLGHAYGKLGIRSRAELPAALGDRAG